MRCLIDIARTFQANITDRHDTVCILPIITILRSPCIFSIHLRHGLYTCPYCHGYINKAEKGLQSQSVVATHMAKLIFLNKPLPVTIYDKRNIFPNFFTATALCQVGIIPSSYPVSVLPYMNKTSSRPSHLQI